MKTKEEKIEAVIGLGVLVTAALDATIRLGNQFHGADYQALKRVADALDRAERECAQLKHGLLDPE